MQLVDDIVSIINVLICDKFGNFVVQKCLNKLKQCDEQEQIDLIVNKIIAIKDAASIGSSNEAFLKHVKDFLFKEGFV